MKLGAHISAAGGPLNIFSKAQQLGVNCFQMFASSPRMWRVTPAQPQMTAQFKAKLAELGFAPSYIHIKYLVNLVRPSPNPDTVTKSVQAVVEELTFASELGLRGGMFHIGAHQGADKVAAIDFLVDKCRLILQQVPANVYLLLENSATDKKLGASLEEIAIILTKLNHPQIKVCLDTAHAFESGHDLRSAEMVDQYVQKIEATIGLDQVELFHVNDSKTKLGSNHDRHENIGAGEIGLEGFRALLNHPQLQDKPFILEVPGFDGDGPDKQNVEILKGLAKGQNLLHQEKNRQLPLIP